MSAQIMEIANELAEAIAESDELAAVRNAEYSIKNDPEAVQIISEFQVKQRQFHDLQRRGEELSDLDQKVIAEIESRMQDNSVIRVYLDASERFEFLMRNINLVISRAISGNQGCNCGPDCGPDCDFDCEP